MSDQNFRVKRGLEVGVGKTVFYADPGGNIGVGKSAPQVKLDIRGTLGVSNTDDTSVRSTIISSSTGLFVNHNDNSSTIFQNQGAERLRITDVGDVGIGTNNPLGGAALTNNDRTLAVGIITTNTLFSGDVQSSTANITTLTAGTINATTINADIEGVAEGVKVQTVGINSEFKFGLIPDHVTSGASAIFLDNQTDPEDYLSYNTQSNRLSTSGRIVAGRGSGSVALTLNDGYGNANVAFNHEEGIPDVNGSSARIRADVDSNTANIRFQLKNSVGAGVTASLNDVLHLKIAEIISFETIRPSSNNSFDLGTSSNRWNNLFVKSINATGVSTFKDKVHLLDDDKLHFGGAEGDDGDLQIYHDGNTSQIRDEGTGRLFFASNGEGFGFIKTGGETLANLYTDGAVELFYDNSKKFETTGIGVSIVNGTSDTATISAPANLIIDPAVVGDNTGLVRIKGDLFVDGTQTIVNSSIVEIADKVVGIATTSTTEVLLDGAGIGIGPDSITKTFLYNYNGGTNPSLKSSENLNVATGKVYQIAETERLSVDTLSLGTGTTIHSPASNVLTLGTNGEESLRITSIGRVGIGTETPTSKLHIYDESAGTDLTITSGNANAVDINLGDIDDHDIGRIRYNNQNDSMLFNTNGTNKLVIESDGDVLPGADSSQDLGSSSKRWDVIYANSVDGTLTGTISNATNANNVDITNNTSSSSTAKFIHFGNLSDNYDGVEVDSSSLVYKNRSLGIGVANPSAKLDVSGDIHFNNNVLIASSDGSTNIDHIWHDDNPSFGKGGTWNFVSDSAKRSTGNSAIQIGYLKSSGGGHFLDSVGIGTTNPSGTLHLSANNPVLRLTDVNQATDNRNWNIAAGIAQILRIQAINDAGTGGGQLFDFYRSGTQIQKFLGRSGSSYWFAVDNNNRRVGVGTDNPQHKLNVYNETASATGGILVQNITYSSNEDRPYLTVGTKDWTGATTNWNTFGFEHRIKSNSGGSPRITVDSLNGELFTIGHGGDIGIGVTNPTAKLDVDGDIYVKDKIATSQHPSNSFLDFDDDNIPGVLGQSGANYVTLGSISGLNLIFDTNNNDDHGLVIGSGNANTANAAKHMVINGAGLVGIGSEIPAAKLDVDGNILPSVHNTHNIGSTSKRWNTIFATNVNATTITGTVSGTADNANNVQITNNTSSSTTAKFIHFGNLSSNYDGVEVDSSSLVFKDRKFGINQTNPGASLDIGGNTDGNIQAILTRGADANFQLQFRNETSSNDAHTVTGKFGLFRYSNDIVGMRFRRGVATGAGSLDFTTGGVERVRITSDGKVGIGTDDPEATLDVYGDNTSAGGLIQITQDGTGDAAIDFQLKGTREYSLGIDNSDGDKFKLSGSAGLANNTLLTVTNDGLVGIGTDDPERKLDVIGDVGVEGDLFLGEQTAGSIAKLNGSGGSVDIYSDATIDFIESDNNKTMVTFDINTTHDDARIYLEGDSDTYFNHPDSNQLGFTIGGTDTMRLKAGNVGIGTDVIARGPLHIHQPSTSDCQIHLTNNNTGTTSSDGFTIFAGTSNGDSGFVSREPGGAIEFYTTTTNNNIAERVRIESDGDLIPGANGSQDLGSSSKKWNTIYANNINGTITGTISNANNVNITDDTGNSGTHYLHFGSATSGFDGVEVDSNGLVYKNGNLGIGDNNPSVKLDVGGDINFNGNVLISSFASSGNIDHIWHDDDASFGTGGTWNFVSDSTRKATGNSAIQIGFLKSSGGGHFLNFVGIGTTTPLAELDVRGYARFGPIPGAVGAATTFQGISLINGKDSSAAESISFVDFNNNLNTTDAHIFAKHQTDGSAFLVFGTTPPGDRTTNRRVDNLTITADGGTQLYSVGNGGTFSTGNTGTSWWKVGEFVRVSQGFRGHLKILGASSYSNDEKSAGATYVNLVIENSNNVEGSFYGVTAGNETIQDVRVKYTPSTEILEVYVRPQSTFAGISVIPYGSGGGWTAFATNTGSTSNPSGTVAIPSEYNLTTGGNIRLKVESDGDVLPGTDGSQDLGSSSKRWDVIYANSIDGTLTGTVTNANNVNINNITSSNDTKKFIHFGDLNNGYDGVEVDSTTLVYRNKNFGIGTDNPLSPLDIAVTSGSGDPRIRFDEVNDDPFIELNRWTGTGTNYYGIRSRSRGGDLALEFANSTTTVGNHSYTERLRITSAGEVGIGVEDPNEKLDVNGSALIRTRAAINISTLPSEGNLTVYGSGKNSLIIQTNDNSSSRGIAFRNSGNNYTGFISMVENGANRADMVFGVDNSNSAAVGDVEERLRITREGHIGVGTTLPNSAVASNNNQILHVGIITARQLYVDEISGDTVSGTIENANKVNITNDTSNSGTHYIHFGSATSGFDGVEVDSGGLVYKDGKVGIHSASPETGLDISSDDGIFVRTASNGPTNGARIQFSDQTSTDQRGHIIYKHPDNSISPGSNDGFLIGGTENTSVVRVQGRAIIDEKVGIGTDDPKTKLHVESATGFETRVTISQQKSYGAGTGTTERAGLDLAIREPTVTADNRTFARIETGPEAETSSEVSFLSFSTRTGGNIGERLRINSSGDLLPGANGTQNIGSNSKKWKDIYLSGDINLSGDVEIDQLLVTGISTFKNKVHLLDNDILHFGGAEGDDGDLQIYHDGGTSFIEDSGTGNLHLKTNGSEIKIEGDSTSLARFFNGGSVELYHNNAKKLETGQYGVTVTGTLAASNIDLSSELNFVGANNKYIDFYTKDSGGTAYSANLRLVNHDSSSYETAIKMVRDGAVELYHNNSKKFETTSTGVKVIGDLEVSGVLSYDDVSNIDSVGIITAQSDIHVFKASDGTSGNVGIGTNIPATKLDILNGSARVTNADKTNIVELTTDGNIEIKRTGGGAFIDFADSTSQDFDARIQHNSGLDFYTGIHGDSNNPPQLRLGISTVGHLIPGADNSQEIGSSSKVWSKIYVNEIIGDNTITGTITNATNAEKIKVTENDSNQTCYLTFINRDPNSLQEDLFGDDDLQYNPNSNDLSTTGDIVAGRGSGSIALTINDSEGNSNVTFNHQNGVPDQNGNSGRIRVNTDRSGGATAFMGFELKDNVTGGADEELSRILTLNPGSVVPGSNNNLDLGSSSLKWGTVYATTFNGAFQGNATTATTATNANNVNINNITSSNDTKKFIHFGDLTNGYDGVEIDATTLVYRNKNFGIGTDDPISPLDILLDDGAGDPRIRFDVTSGDDPFIELNRWTGNGTNYYAIRAKSRLGDLTLEFPNSVTTIGSHSYSEKLRITSAGEVGIGTDDPQAFLRIETPKQTAGWQIRTDSYGLNNESGFYRDANDDYEVVLRNGEGGLAFIKNNGTSSDPNLIFHIGTSEKLRITNDGDLIPNANGTQEIGSSSKYWEKIYVNAIQGSSTITGTIENADKLDGQHGSFYLDTSTTSQTKTGQLIIDTDNNAGGALRILADQTNPSNHFYFAQEIVSTLSGSTATGGDKNQGGIHIDVNSTATGGDTSNEHRAYGIFVDLDSTGDSDAVYGVYSDATATPTTGTASEIAGVYGRAEDNGGDGNVTNVYGVRGLAVSDNSTSDTDNMYGGHFKSQPKATTGDIGSAHGVYAEIEIVNNTGDHLGAAYVFRAEFDDNDSNDPQVAQSCTSYLYYGNYAGTLPTNPYGVYISDDVPNYFGGSVFAGGPIDAGSSAKLQVNGFQRTGTIFLHVGTSPTTTNHALSNNNGTLQWDGNDVLTKATGNVDSRYLRSDESDTMNGILTVGGNSVSANEGGEINLTLAPNSNLSNVITIDNHVDKLRFFEGSGSSAKGAFLDLANCDSAAGSEILHSGSAAQTKSGNMTFTGNVTIEDSELKVGDVSGDSYVLIKQVLSDDYGFDWQHNNASVFINEQGTTNQALVLGDVDANNSYSGLFGISHSTNGGTSWTKKLDLKGDGDLYIGSSAQNKVLTEADLGGTTIDGKYLRSDIADIAAGNITFNAGLTIGSNQTINHNNTGSRDKIRVWTNSSYAIGMDNAMSFGGLNDYAMTFQMNSDADRGWVFLDANHTDAQGAMSLTTQGKMTVAHSLRLGYGESDTTTPGATHTLDVSGSVSLDGDVIIGNDDNGGHASYDSTAALRVDGDSGVALFATNNAQSADPVAVFYKNDDANNVPAVIVSSDADNGDESIFDVRGRQSQSAADLSATSNSADTIFDVRGDGKVYATGEIYALGRYSSSTKKRVLTEADIVSGGTLDGDYLRSDEDDIAQGKIKFEKGIENGDLQGYADYDALIDMGSTAGTEKRIISASLAEGNYSTIAFSITVIDNKSNHANSGTVNTVETSTYIVNMVRTDGTTANTPDQVYIRGPKDGDLIRARKISTGNYEVTLRSNADHREYRVIIKPHGVNLSHTINYHNGDTPTANPSASYTSSVSQTNKSLHQGIEFIRGYGRGTLEFNSTLETYDPAGGSGSETSTSVAIALPSGKKIAGYDDGYIRNLLSWSNGSNIVIGQQSTSKIQGIQLKPGNNAGVKLHYGGNGDNLKFETTSTGAKITGNLEVTGVLSYDDVTNIDSVGIITAQAGIHVSGGNIKFGPGTSLTDDAHIEWLGGNNDGNLRISTSDDGGSEYIELGDYASTDASGTFTRWMKLNRSELYMASAVRLNGALKDKDGDTGSNGQVLVSTGSQVNWVNSSSVGTDTQLTNEQVQDIVGAMVSGNTETNMTVTYDDSSGKLNFATNSTLSNTTASQANLVRIKTATGSEFKNITFVDRDVANNNYDDIKIDSEDDRLAYNPGTNTFKTANIIVTANTELQGELNLIGGSNTDKYIDCRTGDNNALHIRTTAGGDTNHELMAVFRRNAEVALYHDASKKFQTTSTGIQVDANSGNLGGTAGDAHELASFETNVSNTSYLKIIDKRDSNGSDWTTAYTRIQKRIDNTDQGYIQFNGAGNNYGMEFGTTSDEKFAEFKQNGAVILYYDNGERFRTQSAGAKVTGELKVTADIVAFTGSDERLKDNLTTIDNPLDKVLSLGGYTFDWNENTHKEGSDTGVIAQQVEALGLPGMVTTRDDGYKAVRYEKLVPLLIESIKEMKGEMDELRDMVRELKNKCEDRD